MNECVYVYKRDTCVPTLTTVYLPAASTYLLSWQFQEGEEKQTRVKREQCLLLSTPVPRIPLLFL